MPFMRIALIVAAGVLALGLGVWLSIKTTFTAAPKTVTNSPHLGGDKHNKALFDAFYKQPLTQLGAENTLSIAALAGKKYTVVNLWATWCTPCREEMPEFEAFSKTHGTERGVTFVGVAIDRADPVARFVAEAKIGYPIVFADLSAVELTKNYGNEKMALPFSYIVDAKGQIIKTKLGKLTTDELLAITGK